MDRSREVRIARWPRSATAARSLSRTCAAPCRRTCGRPFMPRAAPLRPPAARRRACGLEHRPPRRGDLARPRPLVATSVGSASCRSRHRCLRSATKVSTNRTGFNGMHSLRRRPTRTSRPRRGSWNAMRISPLRKISCCILGARSVQRLHETRVTRGSRRFGPTVAEEAGPCRNG